MIDMRKKISLACRILCMEGFEDFSLGHISCRIPDQKNSFFIKPSGLGLGETKPGDLIVVDLEGNKLRGKYGSPAETAIHTEIYKIRSDVQSIVHVHPIISTAFTSTRVKIKPLNQDGVLFFRGVPRFESAELIVTKKQGKALAQELGKGTAVFLQNHGVVTVGESIESACLNALFLERALKVQLIASLFGKPKPIPPKSGLKMYAMLSQNRERYENMWRYLVRKLKRKGLDFG